MPNENEQDEAQEQEVVTNPADVFAEKLAALTEEKSPKPTDAGAEVDADEDATEDTETEETQKPESKEVAKVEGPSIAVKAWAKQAGLDPDLIAIATSDDQLGLMVEKLVASRETEQKPEPTPEPEFKLELPEDEFPAGDPVRKTLESMNDFYAKQIEKSKQDTSLLATYVKGLLEETETSKQQQLVNEQGTFDAYLDSLENEVLGNYQDGTHNHDVREAIYGKFWRLKQENPKSKDADLINEAAKAFGIKSQQTKRKEALASDNKKRLGGGPTKSVPEPQLSGREKALADIDAILARSK